MHVFILNKKTLQPVYSAPATTWGISSNIYDEISNVNTATANINAMPDDIVICDTKPIGIVKEITQMNNGETQIRFNQLNFLLNQNIYEVTNDDCSDGIELFMKRQIEKNVINQPDLDYRFDRLIVYADTATPSAVMPDVENQVWSIKAFANKVRRLYGVYLEWSMANHTLILRIRQKNLDSQYIDLADSTLEVLSETFTNEQVAKVSYRVNNVVTTYYKLADGSIVTDPGERERMQGSWVLLIADDIPTAEQQMQDTFATSQYSHMVEFKTNKEIDFYSPLRIRDKQGRVFDSYVSRVYNDYNDDRTTYTSGELRLSLTAKLNKGV